MSFSGLSPSALSARVLPSWSGATATQPWLANQLINPAELPAKPW